MLQSLRDRYPKFPVKRRRFPWDISNLEEFERCVDLGVLDCFEPPAPFLSRKTPIVTMGSCFADNIGRNLRSKNYDVFSFSISDRLFTPFALQFFSENILRDGRPVKDFGHHWSMKQEQVDDLRTLLKSGSATVIVTLGLSVAWFDKVTDEMVFYPNLKDSDRNLIYPDFERFEMRQTAVSENTDAIFGVINAIRALHPLNKIVTTLSPISIDFSASDYPVVVADCISKSTLRVALDEMLRLRLKDVYYFPSYEILKWLAPMVTNPWFEENQLSHVRTDWIAYVMSKFMRLYCIDDVTPVAPPIAQFPRPK